MIAYSCLLTMESVVIEVQSMSKYYIFLLLLNRQKVTKSYVSKHYCGLSFLPTFKTFLPIKLYSVSVNNEHTKYGTNEKFFIAFSINIIRSVCIQFQRLL